MGCSVAAGQGRPPWPRCYDDRMATDDIHSLRRILGSCRSVAIVGLSEQWHRPSHFVAKYLLGLGWQVVPVNPRYPQILGQACYARLEDIPFAVHMVDDALRTIGQNNNARVRMILQDAIPATMAATKAQTRGSPKPLETIAGPGQKPARPHPSPKTSEPNISALSTLARSGTMNVLSNNGAERRNATR